MAVNQGKSLEATTWGKEEASTKQGFATWLDSVLPRLLLSPTVLFATVFIYGFIAWTGWVSLTKSRMMPRYEFSGFSQYVSLFENDRWLVALSNLMVFGVLFIGLSLTLGVLLAILLDQKVKAEGIFRTVYLYPMALSFIVTGTAWKWILNPGLGVERLVKQMGVTDFSFDWLIDPEMAIYTVVIAGVWQSSGFVMALCLAGLRGVDGSIIEAARIDGAGLPTIYWKIIIPSLRPVILSSIIMLTHIAIKSFDLIVVLTNGGPGYATEVPATFMYTYAFTRSRLAYGSASAIVMFLLVLVIIIPYLIVELRREQ